MRKALHPPKNPGAINSDALEPKEGMKVLMWLMYAGEDQWIVCEYKDLLKEWLAVPGFEMVRDDAITYWFPMPEG